MGPLHAIVGQGSQVGAMAEDWPIALNIGMGKAGACRMILEGVREMNMGTRAFQGIVVISKSSGPKEVHILSSGH